jgi:hypothetical protein
LLQKYARGADADELKLIELPFTERVTAYQTGERSNHATDHSRSKDPLDPRNRAREKVELQILLEVPSDTKSTVYTTTATSPRTRKDSVVVHWPSYGPFRVFVAQILAVEGESRRMRTATTTRELFPTTTTTDTTLSENEPMSVTDEPTVNINTSEDVVGNDEEKDQQVAGLAVGSTVLFLVKADSCVDDSRRLEPSSSVRVFDPMQVSLNPFLSSLVRQLSLTKMTIPPVGDKMTGVLPSSDTASTSSISLVPSFEDIKSVLICTQLWEPIES